MALSRDDAGRFCRITSTRSASGSSRRTRSRPRSRRVGQLVLLAIEGARRTSRSEDRHLRRARGSALGAVLPCGRMDYVSCSRTASDRRLAAPRPRSRRTECVRRPARRRPAAGASRLRDGGTREPRTGGSVVIGILSRRRSLYTTRRLVESACGLVTSAVLNPLHCVLVLSRAP